MQAVWADAGATGRVEMFAVVASLDREYSGIWHWLTPTDPGTWEDTPQENQDISPDLSNPSQGTAPLLRRSCRHCDCSGGRLLIVCFVGKPVR